MMRLLRGLWVAAAILGASGFPSHGEVLVSGVADAGRPFLDNGIAYWIDNGVIKSMDLATRTEATLASGLNTLAVTGTPTVAYSDGTYLYGSFETYNPNVIFRTPLSGGSLSVVADFSSGSFLTLASGRLYFSRNFSHISSVAASGGAASDHAASYFVRSTSLNSSASSLYFTNYSTNNLHRFDLSDNSVATIAPSLLPESRIFATDSTIVVSSPIILNSYNLYTIPLGGGAQTQIASGVDFGALAVNDGWIYYRDGSDLRRFGLSGGNSQSVATLSDTLIRSLSIVGNDILAYGENTDTIYYYSTSAVPEPSVPLLFFFSVVFFLWYRNAHMIARANGAS